ncbi:hypothetical protein TCAL_15512, partial [Tigriopus californicus]
MNKCLLLLIGLTNVIAEDCDSENGVCFSQDTEKGVPWYEFDWKTYVRKDVLDEDKKDPVDRFGIHLLNSVDIGVNRTILKTRDRGTSRFSQPFRRCSSKTVFAKDGKADSTRSSRGRASNVASENRMGENLGGSSAALALVGRSHHDILLVHLHVHDSVDMNQARCIRMQIGRQIGSLFGELRLENPAPLNHLLGGVLLQNCRDGTHGGVGVIDWTSIGVLLLIITSGFVALVEDLLWHELIGRVPTNDARFGDRQFFGDLFVLVEMLADALAGIQDRLFTLFVMAVLEVLELETGIAHFPVRRTKGRQAELKAGLFNGFDNALVLLWDLAVIIIVFTHKSLLTMALRFFERIFLFEIALVFFQDFSIRLGGRVEDRPLEARLGAASEGVFQIQTLWGVGDRLVVGIQVKARFLALGILGRANPQHVAMFDFEDKTPVHVIRQLSHLTKHNLKINIASHEFRYANLESFKGDGHP